MAPKKRKPSKRELSPRQKKLVRLLPDVHAGKKTKTQAMLEAGYAASSANQQSEVLGNIRNNTRMQDALRKAGFTEEFLAAKIMDGAEAYTKGMFGTQPDFRARAQVLKIGADMLDAFPAKKLDVLDVTPMTYADTEKPKAKTLAEAKAMAEEVDEED